MRFGPNYKDKPQKTIEDKKATVKAFSELSEEFGESVEADHVSAITALTAHDTQQICESLPFDVTAIYCVKTGQLIGHRDWAQIYALVSLKSPDQAKYTLTALQENACAAHWLQTDADILERLRVVDPISYFVYTASYVIAHHYKSPKILKDQEPEARARLMREKILAHKQIASVKNREALHIANGHLANLLTYNPEALKLPYKTLQDVAQAFLNGSLYSTISTCFTRWITSDNKFASIERLSELLNENQGPTQYKKRKGRPLSGDSKLLFDLFAEFGIKDFQNNTLPKGPLEQGQPRPAKKGFVFASPRKLADTAHENRAEVSALLDDINEPQMDQAAWDKLEALTSPQAPQIPHEPEAKPALLAQSTGTPAKPKFLLKFNSAKMKD